MSPDAAFPRFGASPHQRKSTALAPTVGLLRNGPPVDSRTAIANGNEPAPYLHDLSDNPATFALCVSAFALPLILTEHEHGRGFGPPLDATGGRLGRRARRLREHVHRSGFDQRR